VARLPRNATGKLPHTALAELFHTLTSATESSEQI
jgi:acyl-coenzyme A synthetase/AMP-(fatty) acid ligase